MAVLTAVVTFYHYNIKTIAHFSVMMVMNYKVVKRGSVRLVGSGMTVEHSITFFIVPTSQHWYLTVDHVTHLTLAYVWWSVRMVITGQETPSNIFVASMV